MEGQVKEIHNVSLFFYYKIYFPLYALLCSILEHGDFIVWYLSKDVLEHVHCKLFSSVAFMYPILTFLMS